jgi:hypothetical protein
LARGKNLAERWLWYTPKTQVCVPLDAAAYPSTMCGGHIKPLPSWACQSPNGGIHIDRRTGRIDLEAAKTPSPRVELNWSCPYGIPVVAKAWLDEIKDLIDETRTSIGEFRRLGRALGNWATLNEADAPTLFGTEGWAQQCPVCGNVYTMIAGRQFFADPRVIGRPLIVGDHGIFVREDLALARELRTPSGAFKPSVVKFLANPPAIRAAPDWDVEASPTQPRKITRPTLGAGLQRAVAAMGRLLRP